MLIRRIKLQNLLSFGADGQELELQPLNVLIGPNGSGKSNLIEAIGLVQSAPANLPMPIRRGGGVGNWIWRRDTEKSIVRLEVVVDNPFGQQSLRYGLSFTESDQRFILNGETIENEHAYAGHDQPYLYYESHHGSATINYRTDKKDRGYRELKPDEIAIDQSILAQRKDPEHYPELTYLGEVLGKIRIYREWSLGRYSSPRIPQSADLPNDFLGGRREQSRLGSKPPQAGAENQETALGSVDGAVRGHH